MSLRQENKGPLEEAQLLATQLHELRELLGLPGLEIYPALHVHTTSQAVFMQ